MTESPPTKPGADSADDAALSVQEQLDQLLAQIETEEPGTVDPGALPAGYQPQSSPPTPTPPAPEPPPGTAQAQDAPADEQAQAMQNFEQALDGAPPPLATTDPTQPAPAETQAETEGEDETDMLAALNAALQDLNPKSSSTAEPEPQAQAQAPQGLDESSLQDEISALLNAPPQAEPSDSPQATRELKAQSTPAPAPADAPATAEHEASTEDQIAAEIESLLDAGVQSQADQPSDDAQGHPSIDELDQLLADEIDDDDELAGDFQSVEDITAGIDTGQTGAPIDEHAATANDVAAELDSQPEDLASASAPTCDLDVDLDEIAANAQRNAKSPDHESEQSHAGRDWPAKLALLKEQLLLICFAINWPARRFLSREWRANLGYIALINLFVGVALWLYLIIR